MNVIEELKRLAAADSTPEATRRLLIEAIVLKTSWLQPHIHIPRGVPDPLTEEQAEDWH